MDFLPRKAWLHLLLLGWLGGVAVPARAEQITLRWRSPENPLIDGFLLYVRSAEGFFGDPVDLGRPPEDGTGLRSAVVEVPGGSGSTFFLSLRSYSTALSAESGLSPELAVGELNSCMVDRCSTPESCEIRPLPDGTPCGAAGAGQGACLAGRCSVTTCVEPTSARLRIVPGPGVPSLSVRTIIPSAVGLDQRGAMLDLADSSGESVYRLTLGREVLGDAPGSARSVRRGIRAAPAETDLRRLTLTPQPNGATSVRLWIRSPLLDESVRSSVDSLALSIGDLCLRSERIDCERSRRNLITCDAG